MQKTTVTPRVVSKAEPRMSTNAKSYSHGNVIIKKTPIQEDEENLQPLLRSVNLTVISADINYQVIPKAHNARNTNNRTIHPTQKHIKEA